MPGETVGKIPEFTEETPLDKTGIEEVKEAETEKVPEKEKETPAELPAEEKPAEPGEITGEKAEDLKKAVEGLTADKEKLLAEIRELRGQRREIKTEELKKVEEKIDELKGLYPEDIALIDKIVKAKGYISKGEVNKMLYDQVKQVELNQFLEKFPEYKPENDPSDINWRALQRELSYFRLPEDPHRIGEVLTRAHQAISRPSGERGTLAKQRQIETAGVGGGSAQRSPSRKSLPSRYREELSRGGWSENEIKEIEEKQSEE